MVSSVIPEHPRLVEFVKIFNANSKKKKLFPRTEHLETAYLSSLTELSPLICMHQFPVLLNCLFKIMCLNESTAKEAFLAIHYVVDRSRFQLLFALISVCMRAPYDSHTQLSHPFLAVLCPSLQKNLAGILSLSRMSDLCSITLPLPKESMRLCVGHGLSSSKKR